MISRRTRGEGVAGPAGGGGRHQSAGDGPAADSQHASTVQAGRPPAGTRGKEPAVDPNPASACGGDFSGAEQPRAEGCRMQLRVGRRCQLSGRRSRGEAGLWWEWMLVTGTVADAVATVADGTADGFGESGGGGGEL